MSGDNCAIKDCNQPLAVIYLGKPICDKHWDKLSLDKTKLRKALSLPITDAPLTEPLIYPMSLRSSTTSSTTVEEGSISSTTSAGSVTKKSVSRKDLDLSDDK